MYHNIPDIPNPVDRNIPNKPDLDLSYNAISHTSAYPTLQYPISDSPACLERISVNLRRSLTYFLCSRYPYCRGAVQFTETAGGLLEGPSRGGFDFTALINRASDPARCPPTGTSNCPLWSYRLKLKVKG